jgi:hypothetical protein
MPISRSHPPTAALTVAAALSLSILALAVAASPAQAKPTPAGVRVVTGDGKTLADVVQFTDTTAVPTSPRARCFFGGVGGSGGPATVEGPNALGVVADAARSRRRLRPLLVTDEFSFGLGVCGFGGARADAGHFWNVRVNHRGLQVGGDQFRLRPGDEVLWALTPNPTCEPAPPYTCEPGPPELELRAPASAAPGEPFAVRVLEWSDAGERTPSAGVVVTGASAPTDASGVATVTLERTRKLFAHRDGAIAAAELSVCVADLVSGCPGVRGRVLLGSGAAESIRGTPGGDRIKPGAGDDRVRARGGADLIRTRRGGRDRIDCGPGDDIVIADARDLVAGDCELVRR